MIITLIRTIVLYILVLVVMRLMGKREIGQLQPFELAISIMIADLASIPMTDVGIPITNGIIPILGLLVILFFIILGAIIDETNAVNNVMVSVSAGILVSYTCSVISTCYYLLSIIGLINEDRQGPENIPSTPNGNFR